MKKTKILVVERDRSELDLIGRTLSKTNFEVLLANSGEEALDTIEKKSIDLILMNTVLSGMDGFSMLRQIKSKKHLNHIMIMILSDRCCESDVVAGLELGADDYITKPFLPNVLVARIFSVLRCKKSPDDLKENLLRLKGLDIDFCKHKVCIDSQEIGLTPTEFRLLALLASKPGWVFSRAEIVEALHGKKYSVTSISVHIANLRKKLGYCANYIETIHCIGYRFHDCSC